jgi:hypothetical protein
LTPAAASRGNPDVTPFLVGAATPALNYEQGWKDTVIMYPGQVTRIMVRWAPNPFLNNTPANASYPSTPTATMVRFGTATSSTTKTMR